MQFDFLRRKISLFFIRNLCMEYIIVPFQNTVNKIQWEETLALIFFVQLSVNLRNSTVTSFDFFYCGSKIV